MIAAAVLAAGASRRLGQRKQLLPTTDGPLLRSMTARVLAARGIDAVAVVLGAHREEIAPALCGLDVTLLTNDAWEEGMASSVRAAATWAASRGAMGLLLAVCDQIELGTTHLEALLAAGGTAGSAYAGTVGVPAFFAASTFPSLAELRGDKGARDLLRAPGVIAVPWSGGARDVDVPDDLPDALRAQ